MILCNQSCIWEFLKLTILKDLLSGNGTDVATFVVNQNPDLEYQVCTHDPNPSIIYNLLLCSLNSISGFGSISENHDSISGYIIIVLPIPIQSLWSHLRHD